MNSKQIEVIEKAVRSHIVNGLTYLHKLANVGDKLLELGKWSISYSDGAEYDVTALHWDTANEPKGELRLYQEEEGSENQVENYPVTILETDKLIELLAALEAIVGAKYSRPLKIPNAVKAFVV